MNDGACKECVEADDCSMSEDGGANRPSTMSWNQRSEEEKEFAKCRKHAGGQGTVVRIL